MDAVLALTDVRWSIICYHGQQAAEKYLKAFLVSREVTPPKSHDLLRLLSLCVEHGAPVQHLADDCSLLLRFAIATRYPGEAGNATAEDGKEVFAAVDRVRAAIVPLMGGSKVAR